MSSICFSPNSSSSSFSLFSFSFCFVRYRLVGSRGVSDKKRFPRVAVLSRLLQENPPPRRTCEVLSRSCRRILDTTRLGVFSWDHPIPRFLHLFGGYAMHYAIPCVSWKLLSRFSLAFCTYPWCFARDDWTNKIRAMCVYMYVRVFYLSDFT